MSNVVRMRFPADALAELRKLDPDTPVSLSFIRPSGQDGRCAVRSGGRG